MTTDTRPFGLWTATALASVALIWLLLLLSSTLASVFVLSTAGRSLGKAIEFAILLTTSSLLWFYVAICVAALVRRVAVWAAVGWWG